jgi:hypothetical protein
MAGIAVTADGASAWIEMRRPCAYRVDLSATTWGGGTSAKFETATATGGASVVKNPNNLANDYSVDENTAIVLNGPGKVRVNIASYSGTDGMKLEVNQSEC